MKKRRRTDGSNAQDGGAFSRRDFVVRTGLAGAGVAIGSLLWSACSDRTEGTSGRSNTGHEGGKRMCPEFCGKRKAA